MMLIDVGAPTWMVNTVAPGWADAADDQKTARRHARMRPVRALRRIAVSVVMAIGAVVATAVPASAHTVSGQGATNYRTTLKAITPPTPGLTVKVVNLGSDLELTWTGPT